MPHPKRKTCKTVLINPDFSYILRGEIMFAVVVVDENEKRKSKISEQQVGNVGIISVAPKTNSKKLKKVLQKYNGEVILSKTCNLSEIKTFDTTPFKENLLFCDFADFVLSQSGYSLKIGICDPYCHHLETLILPRLIAHAEETVICTELNVDDLCEFWLKSTGTCPFVTENQSHLSDCDVCFAINGVATSGVLFGHGGRGIDQQKLIKKIPEQYSFLLNRQIDPLELLCMLENEEKYCVI